MTKAARPAMIDVPVSTLLRALKYIHEPRRAGGTGIRGADGHAASAVAGDAAGAAARMAQVRVAWPAWPRFAWPGPHGPGLRGLARMAQACVAWAAWPGLAVLRLRVGRFEAGQGPAQLAA
jgi:hypothetical protein